MTRGGFDYEKVGVSLARGDAASAEAFKQMEATFDDAVLIDAGLPVISLRLAIPASVRRPTLHVTADGVGTKLIYAAACGVHHTVGQDLVAMCVDDHSRYNIKPLCFAVYRGTNRIDERVFSLVTKGIVQGCRTAGVRYISGETAEMPGFYVNSHYELVGFCVGVYDYGKLRRGQNIEVGDVLVALLSGGGGSNGFSLIRAVFPPEDVAAGRSLLSADEVLSPTPIYARQVLRANENFPSIRGWAHITGGGLGERGKLASILPDGLCANLDRKSWEVPAIFRKVQEAGGISEEKMLSTFNMGLMMVAPVGKNGVANVNRFLESLGCPVAIVGRVEEQKGTKKVVVA